MLDIQGVSGAVNEAALRTLMERTGFPIEQKPGTGQRIYGPPPVGHPLRDAGQPGRGCEIFVGKLPRDCFEDELVPVLEKCGTLYEARMMMDFTGCNRGFCFATYVDMEGARRATRELNNFEIRPGCHIGVCRSVDNCRLFLGGIPRDKQREHILDVISKMVSGVKDVIVKPDPKEKHKNRGFAFVEFESHHSAAMARRKLTNKKPRMWDQEIAVDWAEPEPEIDKEIMAKVKVLYFYNLMLTTTEQAIEKLCADILGKSGAVERVKKLKDYAFVHFKEREDAMKIMQELDDKEFEGSNIRIALAKPPEKKSQTRSLQPVQPQGLILTNGINGSTIFFQQGIDPNASSKEANMRNPLVMGVKEATKGRTRGAGGIGKVYSRSPSVKKSCPEQLKLAPFNDIVSANPVFLNAAHVKSTVQAFEETCRSRGLGIPQFEISTTTNSSGEECFSISRVILPHFQIAFPSSKLFKTKEESYEHAAFLALKTIEERIPPIMPAFMPQVYPAYIPSNPPPVSSPFIPGMPINPMVVDKMSHDFFGSYLPAGASQIFVAPQNVVYCPPVDTHLDMQNNFGVFPVVGNNFVVGPFDENNNGTYSLNQAGVFPMSGVQPQSYQILLPLAPPVSNGNFQVPVTNSA